MKHPNDMTDAELDKFDDGEYYNDENGDGGSLRSLAFILVSSAFAVAGFVNHSWLIASPAIALTLYSGLSTGYRKHKCRYNRLRGVAQVQYNLAQSLNEAKATYEAARKAEEAMV